MERESHAIAVHGRRLEVLRAAPTAGPAAGSPLVFLHEGLGSASSWRDWPWQIAAATGSTAIVYSRYGHGASDVLAEDRRPSFMREEAAALAELLRRLDVETPILIGHSDGASIALLAAAADPAVQGVVLLAPHVFVEEHGLAGIRAARAAFATTDLALRLGRHHRDPWRTFRGWNDVWLDPAFRGWDIRAEIGRVACPILAIQGFDDPYGTMAQLDEIAAGADDVTDLRLPACGHSPHRDQPERVAAEILGFLGRL